MKFGGAQPLIMQNKKLIRFVQSLVLLPITTISLPLGDLPKEANDFITNPQIVFAQKLNRENSLLALSKEAEAKATILKMKADAIDTYFRKYHMPLEGFGMKMVQEAEKNDIDWRLLAAISARESTGGIHACKKVSFNPFGWGSCKIGFDSYDKAIETVAKNLGGNNPNTAHHYGDKNTKEILQKYNPPSIVAKYADQVIKIMHEIGPEEVIEEINIPSVNA
jgi:hypothetical protein